MNLKASPEGEGFRPRVRTIKSDESWVMRCRDKGIGMTSKILQDHFFKAGSSFRWSDAWAKDYVDAEGKSLVARGGKFGIGAFSLFLLGSSFRLQTRHASESHGYTAEVQADSDAVELRRIRDIHVGTTIEVDLDTDVVEQLELNRALELTPDKIRVSSIVDATDWYAHTWPSVSRRVVSEDHHIELPADYTEKFPISDGFPNWSTISPEGFTSVRWALREDPPLVCNGIKIRHPEHCEPPIKWPLGDLFYCPSIFVEDAECRLPLTIQRYQPTRELPFIDAVRKDVIFSYIAYALVCGPSEPIASSALGPNAHRYPLIKTIVGFKSEDQDVDLPRAVCRLAYASTMYLV